MTQKRGVEGPYDLLLCAARDRNLSDGAYRQLAALISSCPSCFVKGVSVERFAEMTGVSTRTVGSRLRELEGLGYIHRKLLGHGLPAFYKILSLIPGAKSSPEQKNPAALIPKRKIPSAPNSMNVSNGEKKYLLEGDTSSPSPAIEQRAEELGQEPSVSESLSWDGMISDPVRKLMLLPGGLRGEGVKELLRSLDPVITADLVVLARRYVIDVSGMEPGNARFGEAIERVIRDGRLHSLEGQRGLRDEIRRRAGAFESGSRSDVISQLEREVFDLVFGEEGTPCA